MTSKFSRHQEYAPVDHNKSQRSTESPLKILLADDDLHVRSALQVLVNQHPTMQIVGEAADIDTMFGVVWTTRPQLILLDWELPGGVDAALITWLHALQPQPFILVSSSWPEAESLALTAGADAFVSKGRPAADLLRVLVDVACKTYQRRIL